MENKNGKNIFLSVRDEVNSMITEKYNQYLLYANNTKGLSHENPNEVLNECLCVLLENTDEKLEKIKEYLDFYLINMIKYSFRSKTSGYQRKYNKIKLDDNDCVSNFEYDDMSEYDYNKDKKLDIIDGGYKTLSWYEKEIIQRYLFTDEKMSFAKLSKTTDIPTSSLHQTYTIALKKIRDGFNKN